MEKPPEHLKNRLYSGVLGGKTKAVEAELESQETAIDASSSIAPAVATSITAQLTPNLPPHHSQFYPSSTPSLLTPNASY